VWVGVVRESWCEGQEGGENWDSATRTLKCTLVLNVRQPRMEKPGPYCVIGGAPPNFKLPLPIE
jgi:hypothetical protein